MSAISSVGRQMPNDGEVPYSVTKHW